MKQIYFIICSIIALGIFILTLERVDRFLDLKAVSDCGILYRMEYDNVSANTKIIRPLEEPFLTCVWQSGVRDWRGTNQK